MLRRKLAFAFLSHSILVEDVFALCFPLRNEAMFRTLHISSQSLQNERKKYFKGLAFKVHMVSIHSEQLMQSWQPCYGSRRTQLPRLLIDF